MGRPGLMASAASANAVTIKTFYGYASPLPPCPPPPPEVVPASPKPWPPPPSTLSYPPPHGKPRSPPPPPIPITPSPSLPLPPPTPVLYPLTPKIPPPKAILPKSPPVLPSPASPTAQSYPPSPLISSPSPSPSAVIFAAHHHHHLSAGAIVGICLAGAFFLVLLLALLLCLGKKKRRAGWELQEGYASGGAGAEGGVSTAGGYGTAATTSGTAAGLGTGATTYGDGRLPAATCPPPTGRNRSNLSLDPVTQSRCAISTTKRSNKQRPHDEILSFNNECSKANLMNASCIDLLDDRVLKQLRERSKAAIRNNCVRRGGDRHHEILYMIYLHVRRGGVRHITLNMVDLFERVSRPLVHNSNEVRAIVHYEKKQRKIVQKKKTSVPRSIQPSSGDANVNSNQTLTEKITTWIEKPIQEPVLIAVGQDYTTIKSQDMDLCRFYISQLLCGLESVYANFGEAQVSVGNSLIACC